MFSYLYPYIFIPTFMSTFKLSIYYTLLIFLAPISCTQTYSPLDLNFTKDYTVRNFYNSQVTLNELDLSVDVLDESKHPQMHLTSPGCAFTQNDTTLTLSNTTGSVQESYISLGKVYNYAAIDLGIQEQSNTAKALLTLFKDQDNRIVLQQRDIDASNKSISLEVTQNGSKVLSETLSAEGIATPHTLRVHLIWTFLNVLTVKDGVWKHIGTIDLAPYFDLRDKALLETFTLYAGASLGEGESLSINKFEHYLSSGTAQADPKVVHYEDGSPIIEGDKIWVAMTTRGYGVQLYQQIFSYDMVTKEWNVTGTLVFDKGDGILRQWAAGDVFYNRMDSTWLVFTNSHREENVIVFSGSITEDIRFGFHEIPVKQAAYPDPGREEDPSVIYDAEVGKWRMAMCNFNEGFETLLYEADQWDGSWKEIAKSPATSSTGILIQQIGRQKYVFQGRGDTPCPLEVLSYPDLEILGELNLSEHPEGRNIWPAIIPLTREIGTQYYLLTFDRDAWTGRRTYGNIHWYYAEEFAQGFHEYEVTQK